MGSSQPQHHDPNRDPIEQFIDLVRGGTTIQLAADTVGIPHYLAYCTAHNHDLPFQRHRTPQHMRDYVAECWQAGWKPMDIARHTHVRVATVYDIGVELGLWQRPQHGRTAAHTTRRCAYLRLRINALSRKDALAALGLHESSGRDFDRGVTRTSHGPRPFIPDGPDAFLYKRLMQLMPYVDGRTSIPVQVIPQHRIDQRIHTKFLSIEEREIIADMKNQGHSIRAIARRLGRSPGTISKELTRHADDFGLYMPQHAQRMSVLKRFRPKQRKIDANPALGEAIWQMLGQRMSPEQIAGRLRKLHPDDQTMWVCTETIYQALFVQAKGELKQHIKACLRQGRAVRKPRRPKQSRQRFHDPMVMISDRPATVEDRAVPGHWEGDLIMGAGNKTAIGTLVERSTRYVMLLHLPNGHDALQVRDGLVAAIGGLPEQVRGSVTWDQGSEMAGHRWFSVATGCPVYFCDPGSPWQRGSNENTNGLLRQYFPKGTDLGVYTAADLEFVAAQLNSRPRKTLGFDTPAERMAQLLGLDSNDM